MNLNEIIRKAAEMDGEKAGVQEYWRTLLNYDEAKVSYSSVPSPLINRDGTRITTVAEWENFRRKEIIESYKKLMYGELPGPPDEMDFEILNTKTNALDDTAIRKEIRITMRMKNGRQHHALMLLYDPAITEAAGVTIPEQPTLEELYEIGEIIYEKTGVPTYFDGGINMMQMIARMRGSHIFDELAAGDDSSLKEWQCILHQKML